MDINFFNKKVIWMFQNCQQVGWRGEWKPTIFLRNEKIIFLNRTSSTVRGQKKRHMFFCSSFLNFWDMRTLILSKDRIFDIVFGGIIFKMRQLLVDPQMAQNQKWQKNFCSFLYPWAFFGRVCYVPHIIPTSNIYFGLILLIPVILSYIAAGYDHFRPFYQILKNDHF